MELPETGFVELEVQGRSPLLAPYDVIVTLPDGVRIEVGRFSFGMLKRVRVIANSESRCLLKIGAFCEIAQDATILVGGEHRNDSLLNYTFGDQALLFRSFVPPEDILKTTVEPAAPVEIGNNVIVSMSASILGGAKIGDGTVIAAGAVVAGDCDSRAIYAGVPARKLRDRFSPEIAKLYGAARLHDVMAHDVPKLPGLLDRLQSGEITLEQYWAAVHFLPARPAIHFSAVLNAENHIVLAGVRGFLIDGKPVEDAERVEALRVYFKQLGETGKVRWTPDIFHTIGLY
jgi:acetyltransferase-like isoleucine patch superfamily enzyme